MKSLDKIRDKFSIRIIAMIVVISFISFSLGVLADNGNNSSSIPTIIEAGSGVETASYIIYQDGDYTCAKNGTTGRIDFRSENATYTIQSAIDGIVQGIVAIKPGNYSMLKQDGLWIDYCVKIHSDISIIMEDGVVLTLADNQNCSIFYAHGSNNIKVMGGELNGNKIRQEPGIDYSSQIQSPPGNGRNFHAFALNSTSNSIFSDIYIHDIRGYAFDVGNGSCNNTFENNKILTVDGGIRIHGPFSWDTLDLTGSCFNTVFNNRIEDWGPQGCGVYLYSVSSYNIVSTNQIFGSNRSDYAISTGMDSSFNQIVSNHVRNQCIVVSNEKVIAAPPTDYTFGNVISNNVLEGTVYFWHAGTNAVFMQLYGCKSTIVSGNSISGDLNLRYCIQTNVVGNTINASGTNGGWGIGVYNTCKQISLTGNMITCAKLYGIYVFAGTDVPPTSDITISSNFVGYMSATSVDQVRLKNVQNVTIVGNTFADYNISHVVVGVNIQTHANNKDVIIDDNIFAGKRNYFVYNPGNCVVQIGNNIGWVTKNSGNATMLSGDTMLVISHGLTFTPTKIFVSGSTIDTSALWITSITSTQFTINVASAVGGNRNIFWYAEY